MRSYGLLGLPEPEEEDDEMEDQEEKDEEPSLAKEVDEVGDFYCSTTVDCKSLVSKTLYQILSFAQSVFDDIIYSLPDWLHVTSN